ncbi:MAG TPA: secondary thiamine-phosphate synthase enzyme YjbQ [Candidatus Brocadiia bacterium]|nr:secondary thiamine-phosphate synthase enzyme YjbQ [Candidatus Brocadiia bacterium]
MRTFSLSTRARSEFVNITRDIASVVEASGVRDGVCTVFVPHTTAAVTINENADPSVQSDLLMQLERLAPLRAGFQHAEGNSDAHVKAALLGSSAQIIVQNGRLALGTWQGVYFCEFDGPRQRNFFVQVQ